ncbi:glycosyltransferase [Parapedobacter soli]|uniref:glycosyltransferase n=1 Tax=Parapedobacter soli TaxID=416955 RepID=UPI0021C76D28|nr:glycosyltransferase [Parapedobacter soli]
MNLERTPQVPPKINRLLDNDERVVWSVMIPVYNCINYLQEALESVLQQAFSREEMQIMVVDDHSTDGDVASLVRRVGKGRIGYFRKDKNNGSLRNFETCINMAKGKYVHILHGDDKISPGFYIEMQRLFDGYPEIGACYSNFNHIDGGGKEILPSELLQDDSGLIAGWLEKIAQRNLLQPPAIAVKREVYERLGSFFAVHYGEDWEMWVRIAAHYPVAYSPKLLAHYRVHSTNISTNAILSGQNIKDIQRVIDIINGYLPKEKRRKLRKIATKNFSSYFATLSDKLYHEHYHRRAALMQAYLALKMHVNVNTVKHVVKTVIKCAIGYRQVKRRNLGRLIFSRR